MFSQAWGPAIDLRDPRFLAFATAEHQLLQSEYDDYAIASSSSLACFRYVAIIDLEYVADDATPVSTPNVDGCKGLSNASGIIIVLQFPDIASSTGWFSPPLLCDGTILVRCTMPKEKTARVLFNS
nr:Protein involved in mRNA turnover and stability [Ipomoea batatas]